MALLVGMARCAVPVAERSVRRRNSHGCGEPICPIVTGPAIAGPVTCEVPADSAFSTAFPPEL